MMRPRARAAMFAVIFLCLATILVVSIQKITAQEHAWSVTLLERNPQFLHCERMQVAVARAAVDALALRTAPSDAALQADLVQQRRQMQADWMGMEQLAARDPQRHGLLLEIRASLADFFLALDQTAALPVSGLRAYPPRPQRPSTMTQADERHDPSDAGSPTRAACSLQ